MTLKGKDLVRIGDRQAKDGCGFTDPSTGWTISPGGEKPLPKKIGGSLRAWINSGAIVAVEKASEKKPEKDPSPDKKPGEETKPPRDENSDQDPDKEPGEDTKPQEEDSPDPEPEKADSPGGEEDEVKDTQPDPDEKKQDPDPPEEAKEDKNGKEEEAKPPPDQEVDKPITGIVGKLTDKLKPGKKDKDKKPVATGKKKDKKNKG
jgi:hypothetical protein